MKANDLRELVPAELKARSDELNEELFNLQFQHATGQLDNPMRLKQVRRDIARVKSVLREKELAEVAA